MAGKQKRYQAYLLRVWRDEDDSSWRAVLEDVHTNKKQGFRDIAELVQHFEQTFGGA
ncbi:MAG TPA: hypothetical protein G4N94_02865 [Caldilineae bacterium]|nr:hypothetical protein [Caldilineae bacterium]